MSTAKTDYLLAGQASELERLQLQSRVWEPSGRKLLEEIGDGDGTRVLDVGCGVLGWLRLLSEWVGPDGEVTGTDVDDAMLSVADRFVTEEGLRNVGLVALQSSRPGTGEADRADRGDVPAERQRLERRTKPPPPAARVRHRRRRQ